MRTQSGETADSQQADQHGTASRLAAARAYAGSHRNLIAIVTVSAITAAIVVPYIASAGITSFGDVVTGQPVNHETPAAKDTTTMDQQEQPQLQQTTGTSSNHSQTNVTVNGQAIEVPQNGSYNKTIDDGNSHTEIHVDSNHSSSSTGNSSSNNSSVQLNVHSESHSSSED